MKNGHPTIAVDGIIERPYEWMELVKMKNPPFHGNPEKMAFDHRQMLKNGEFIL